jgi:glyoxylase-like metal-dependent hydrolase (beta-lactamase superfamily II)
VLDYDVRSGHSTVRTAARLLDHIRRQGLVVDWILETHCHADHLSAAQFFRSATGAPVCIGAGIPKVQAVFKGLFNAGDLAPDGSQFDRLFADGEVFAIGRVPVTVLHTPGHTPACVSYLAGDAVFVGDTLFMPDYGTARADFPGGDAAQLYRSIRRILALPPATRVFTCHDYKAPGRDHFAWEASVAEHRARNVHVRDGVDEKAFVAMRTRRDAKLDTPALMLPSVQVNMRAGHFPPAEENGIVYLKLPLDRL